MESVALQMSEVVLLVSFNFSNLVTIPCHESSSRRSVGVFAGVRCVVVTGFSAGVFGSSVGVRSTFRRGVPFARGWR